MNARVYDMLRVIQLLARHTVGVLDASLVPSLVRHTAAESHRIAYRSVGKGIAKVDTRVAEHGSYDGWDEAKCC